MSARDNTFKRPFMAGTIAVALLAAVVWSCLRLADARAAALAAGQDAGDCRALAARIDLLRRQPAVAGAQELGASDLSRQIEQAARTAHFPEDSIERIEPESPRRVGETNYREVPTQVRLRRVSLQQVFTFLRCLSADSPQSSGLHLRSIRLSAPRGEETSDRWSAESTLTYMIYSQR